jgi:hypothetical protein
MFRVKKKMADHVCTYLKGDERFVFVKQMGQIKQFKELQDAKKYIRNHKADSTQWLILENERIIERIG